jgi:hypothetical protein
MRVNTSYMPIILLVVPLILSAYTHLYNPIGFPSMHGDEGHYLRRAMHVLGGLGPEEKAGYDHPYFGQIFLASIFSVIGYPDLLYPTSGEIHSIEMLHLVPRLIIGVLALFDTFLIYKISEARYNKTVAFIASILFAVMPLTWLVRRVFLDSIQLPFILSSILFAIYCKENLKDHSVSDSSGRVSLMMTFLSGVFLGLAIFTKIPAFTMIPLIGFLVYTNTNRSLQAVGLWLLPVLLVPALWTTHALSTGEFQYWLNDALSQTQREGLGILSISLVLEMDPVLVVLGLAGTIFALFFKRDSVFLLWIVPFMIFIYFVDWVTHFHWILLLPPFCIAAGVLIDSLLNKASGKIVPIKKNLQLIATISGVGIFGLVSITPLITMDVNFNFFESYAFVVNHLRPVNSDTEEGARTLVGNGWVQSFSWIPKYVFNQDHDFKRFYTKTLIPDENVLLIIDGKLERLLENKNSDEEYNEKIPFLYNKTEIIGTFDDTNPAHYDDNVYPYSSMRFNGGIGKIEIRTDS